MLLKNMRGIAVIVAGLALGIAAPPIDAAPTYTATRLGTLGGTAGYGNGINASGQVTGFSYTAGNATWHAVIYVNGTLHDLGTLGGGFSSGSSINGSGQVAGFAATPNARRAFLYANGVMTDLGTLGGTSSGGSDINASGQITGDSAVAGDTTEHAFLYSNGVMTDLGTLGGRSSEGTGINASGQVTGRSELPESPTLGTRQHAFLYSNGTMRDLGTLGGGDLDPLGGGFSNGTAINDSGQVTGDALIAGGQADHAFLYSDGTMHDLGTLGGQNSYGFGINASGQVVGGANTVDNVQHAFLYSDGTMYDLNLLVVGLAGTVLGVANAINDSGQIVANGCSESLICQAFRLDPVSPAQAPPPVDKIAAIEFHYAMFDHYFLTAIPKEIAALDNGMFPGWVRTGEAFNVYSGPLVESASVCRFFSTSFAQKSSHFYTSDPGECSLVNQNGGWMLEGDVMNIPVPDRAGNCAAGTQPIYRLYNNGQGAAPNHRYTASRAIHSQMLAQGWIAEGYGNDGVIMCSPL